jgi:succinoglycan biosynthesis transport protein ExoP
MTSRDGFRLLRKHTLVVLACIAAGAVAALTLSSFTPRTYESQAQLFVSAARTNNAGGVYDRALFAQGRVKSYVSLVTTPAVMAAVVKRLGLPTTPDQLAKQISVRSDPDTVLLLITARDRSAKGAQNIANATAEEFSSLAASLEGTDGGAPSVQLRITKPAEASGAPVRPRTTYDLALGLFLGAVAGVGLAALRERWSTAIETRQQAETVSGLPVLSALSFDRRAGRRPLPLGPRSVSRRLEDFRRLRARLHTAFEGRPTILVTSASRREGRTGTALNLATVMGEAGLRVAVVDCDIQRPAVHRYLELDQKPGLSDVLAGRVQLEEALRLGHHHMVFVLTSGTASSEASGLRVYPGLKEVLQAVRDKVDVVLLDCPAVLDCALATELARFTDGVLMVVRTGVAHADQLAQAVQELEDADAVMLGLVLNRARGRDTTGPGDPRRRKHPGPPGGAGKADGTPNRRRQRPTVVPAPARRVPRRAEG